MPKFYVQSGNVELVTTAIHSRGAAIWGVHRTLSQSLPFLCDETTDVLALDDLTAPRRHDPRQRARLRPS